MGADGGIVGIRLKDEALTSQAAMTRLVNAVPWELRYWDRYDRITYREADELPGFWYSTYGSFQNWDLGRLPDMVEEAREYAADNPGATFETWVEDIYTRPYPAYYSNSMEDLLTERYLRWSGEPSEPEWLNDGFYKRSVSEWIKTISRHVDLESYPDYQETWT